MQDIINKIKALDLQIASDEEIRDLLGKFDKLGTIAFKLEKGRSIYRSLPMKSCDERYTSKARISYNPNPGSYGRANTPGNSVFYGSITTPKAPPQEEISSQEAWLRQNHGYIVNILECSEFLDKEQEVKEYFTVGMWEVQEDFEVGVIHDPENRHFLSEEMKAGCDDFYSSFDVNTRSKFEALQQLLSLEFCKPVETGQEFQYKISANFMQNLIENGFTGLLYPSFKSGGEAFNVALHPQLVDSGVIQLKRAAAIRIYRGAGKDSSILWDWMENAEHKENEELNYNSIEGVSLNDEGLRIMLRKYRIEHLFK